MLTVYSVQVNKLDMIYGPVCSFFAHHPDPIICNYSINRGIIKAKLSDLDWTIPNTSLLIVHNTNCNGNGKIAMAKFPALPLCARAGNFVLLCCCALSQVHLKENEFRVYQLNNSFSFLMSVK